MLTSHQYALGWRATLPPFIGSFRLKLTVIFGFASDWVWVASCRDPNGDLASHPKSRNRNSIQSGHYHMQTRGSHPSQFASRSGG
ncbi:MAG: hypothetical protein ABS49_04895 [Erythrobacter sp. SCN 62-14]|nr:MAG: hypothetical protein ABS49_04895 [Erythrobacter sp. SCN 62-14]